jgi:hypothetical protein
VLALVVAALFMYGHKGDSGVKVEQPVTEKPAETPPAPPAAEAPAPETPAAPPTAEAPAAETPPAPPAEEAPVEEAPADEAPPQ